MIFLTMGTMLPFDRLARAVDAWAQAHPDQEVIGQLGDLEQDSYRPTGFEWTERLTPVEFRQYIEQADLIVAHAGIGTIVDALTRAKPTLIMARHHALGEHVNDHQLETVAKFADRPGVQIAMDETEIAAGLDALLVAPPAPPLGPDAQDSLIAAIHGAIHGVTPTAR